jgi:hypothetical protein
MRYRDIQPTASRRFRLPATRPILAQIEIDPADWHRIEQFSEDNCDTEIVAHAQHQPASPSIEVFSSVHSAKPLAFGTHHSEPSWADPITDRSFTHDYLPIFPGRRRSRPA